MNVSTDRHILRDTFFALAGLLIWFAHFSIVYAINSLACARGYSGTTVLGMGIVTFSIIAATILAVAGTALVLRAAIRRYRNLEANDDTSARFLSYTAATVAALSIVAIIWDALPVFLVEPCV